MSTTVDPELLSLIETGLTKEASDLHLAVGHAPMLRIHGDLFPAADTNLTREATARMVASIVPTELRDKMASLKDFDFSLTLPRDDAPVRFRVNVFVSQGAIGACLRYVPSQIPSFEWMGIPQDLVRRIVSLHNGLVLITGVTGAGKTTTLAGLVEQLNQLGHRRIVTIEEPIEYLFEPKANSVITQREVGLDVASFADGLRSALRQDPDVILCGEVRDIETARMAISAAETGHLVMSTVHTQDAKGAITRLIDIFPAERQQDIRGQLALSLRIVVSQHLLPSITPGTKRALAMEILVANDAARAAIRLNKIEAIDTAIQTGKRWGMQTLDESLAYLACSRRITPETAYRYAKNPDGLRTLGVPVPPQTNFDMGVL
ncbi:MAG TPA: PilT/PilU family type 4a pilus ATPase [Phycisphaerae bacterium]|nr:PilT/PilU family type 4a pilus ATPase [Phycisphaerae bacterium]HOJ73757.1 PilT/PilU family type 4a pilus ATPase [Phycisphaerae bacterium]HOM50404.1 PilT/PilU family type 4a pilus ATPase [Phycisphaerae bacterium]HOQ84184.1 PilT/PilU family type 4a pilus ATPase [Phycisphaerae bacterium]HPP27313.1 PilT/PilU family type 4a pilus ATPase [Phycisphaerae bacterium]